VVSSWSMFMACCKSRVSALARSLFLSRQHWQRKYLSAEQERQALQEAFLRSESRCRELVQHQRDLEQHVAQLQTQLAQPRPVTLPLGDTPPGHQYGANLIALSVNLGRKLGLRPARHAMEVFSRG
jgi:hypothetical protein